MSRIVHVSLLTEFMITFLLLFKGLSQENSFYLEYVVFADGIPSNYETFRDKRKIPKRRFEAILTSSYLPAIHFFNLLSKKYYFLWYSCHPCYNVSAFVKRCSFVKNWISVKAMKPFVGGKSCTQTVPQIERREKESSLRGDKIQFLTEHAFDMSFP